MTVTLIVDQDYYEEHLKDAVENPELNKITENELLVEEGVFSCKFTTELLEDNVVLENISETEDDDG